MNVSLRPELQAYVEEQVRAGHYSSADDLINAALETLRQQEETDPDALAELRREIDVGLRELERGECDDWDPEEIKAEGRRLLAARDAGARGKAE